MTNRLKAYCRRTVLTAATEGAYPAKRRTAKSTEAAFRDAMHGTDTGWWNDLIYTKDVLRLANIYRRDVARAVRDYLSETGCAASDFADRDREFTWADVLVSTSRRVTWADYDGSNGRANETEAMALCWGLRFAVEWLTGELAREYCPEL